VLFGIKLFEEGLITSGRGAEVVGLSKKAFIEFLGKYKVSIFQYDRRDRIRHSQCLKPSSFLKLGAAENAFR
jgi:predicted HTH domain antitoxin